MAARGGRTKLKITRERQKLALPLPAEELAALLDPLIVRELATIGAIDTVMPRERHPGYVTLMRAAKLGKQASVEQMASMIRVAGVQQAGSGGPIEVMLKLQSALARRIGTTPVLRAMRLAEAEIVRAYGDAYDRLDGIFQKGLEKCWHRAQKHLAVLTAHVAIRSGRPELEEELHLPMPLDRYFAHGEDRVCFRCLFDRPGKLPPIERTDPHPYHYLCAACHHETFGDLPADALDAARRWTGSEREAHVLEHALGRPSKLKAEMLILAKMAGIAPDMPPPPIPYKTAEDVSPKRRAPAQPLPRVELGGVAESPLEQAYADALFDYDTVRRNW
ncbi:MAG TPA: hypothetical protein VJ276_16010, partial [Thermoanaerobaculia bacterium]|nr:hypothetical protein [Thermoanaerobaculia bacterium]